MKLAAGQRTVEKIFELSPGADPHKIVVQLEGAQGLRRNETGELVVSTGYGDVVLSAPLAWQEVGGKREKVDVAYRLDANAKAYGFRLGSYDRSKPLWIDPILQSTYLGGTAGADAWALAIEPTSGQVYVAGRTASGGFPNTAGGAQANNAGGWDAFVARLNAALTSNPQSTYLGGTSYDYAYALAIHPGSREVYVAGETLSTDFPNTAGGAQASFAGGADVFVVRLNATLTSNLQSTYLGGTGSDSALALAIHPGSGEVYLAGQTGSTDFPNTTGGAQANNAGGSDAFVARLNASLTQNPQSTYLGGTSDDVARALAIHPASGEVYVAGYTYSTNFPNTTGGAQANNARRSDAFVARLSAALTSNPQSTYLGGTDDDSAFALAIHPASGEVYVAGWTYSLNFANTTGGAQTSFAGGLYDAFVARLSAALSSNPQSTYLGGVDDESAFALAIHPGSGEVYVAGWTESTDFPNTTGGAQANNARRSDAFVARLNAALTSNPQSTYLGGTHDDSASALAIHPGSGEVYVAGWTYSLNFPNTTGGAEPTAAGGAEAFVARLTADLKSQQTGADMVASLGSLPASVGPGSLYPGLSFSCTNNGPGLASNATCAIAFSAGSISSVSCTPSVPVLSLASGSSISCTYTFTAPGTAGGGNTSETGVTFTVIAGGDNDPNPANNTASNATPVPLVDALDDAASFPANTTQSFNVGSNDQYGTGSLPAGASFSLQAGTTCAGASINATTGIATFQVPASGTCVVAYEVCVFNACDRAQLTVTAQPSGVAYAYWVPVASHAAGLANTQWRTDLGLLNRSGGTANVQLRFYGSQGLRTATTSVADNAQAILVDVVNQLGVSDSGALEVVSDRPLIVTSRTYNQGPSGTYGQNIEAYASGEGLAAGQSAWLPQLTENSSYRCNIAVTNTGATSASVTVVLYDASGNQLASYTYPSLAPGQWKQERPFFTRGFTNLSRAYAKVVVNSGSGVVAYASIVDNNTGDGTTIHMRR